VLQELVSASVDAELLQTHRVQSYVSGRSVPINVEEIRKQTHLFRRKSFRSEIVAAVVEASFDEVLVESHEVLHL